MARDTHPVTTSPWLSYSPPTSKSDEDGECDSPRELVGASDGGGGCVISAGRAWTESDEEVKKEEQDKGEKETSSLRVRLGRSSSDESLMIMQSKPPISLPPFIADVPTSSGLSAVC